MAKVFVVIEEPQAIVTAGRSTFINSCPVNAYLTDDETDTALAALSFDAKQAVLNSLYRLKPGESKKPVSGTYNVSFDYTFSPSLVIVTE